MGIKLDWEIQAEQARVPNQGEDPVARRERWRQRVRGLLLIAIGIGVMAALAALMWVRLRDVDASIDATLRNTVSAEVTAIRIGDRSAFLEIQRSATDEWIRRQASEFERYQALKLEDQLDMTGRVLDTAIDGTRGRVRLEEIIDGVPYARVWFYWRYEDGWHHVPPDYTFWGLDAVLIRGGEADPGVQVRYYAVDAPAAEALADQVAGWVTTACAAGLCPAAPLQIEILPSETQVLEWGDDGVLRLPSPYITGAYLPQPFDPNLQQSTAERIARRLVEAASPAALLYPTDAYYLRESAMAWLINSFLGREQMATLWASIAQSYGAEAVGRVLGALAPNDTLAVLTRVLGAGSLADQRLDWRDTIAWRLTAEQTALATRDRTLYLQFYDQTSQGTLSAANARFDTASALEVPPVVLSFAQGTDATGTPLLRVLVVQPANGEQTTLDFRLIDGVWKRAN